MEEYWNTRLKPTAPTNPTDNIGLGQPDDNSVLSDYDRHRLTLLANQTQDEGWLSEKCRYLEDMPANVTKETDIVEWWQVCIVAHGLYLIFLITICCRTTENHTQPSAVLQSITLPVKLHQYLANAFSRLAVKL